MNPLVIDTETTGKNPHEAKLLGIACFDEGVSSYKEVKKQARASNYLPSLTGKTIVAHNGKYDSIVLAKHGCKNVRIDFDTMIAAYLLQIDKPRKLETLHKQFFKKHKKDLLEIYNESIKNKNPNAKDRKNLPEDWYKEVDHNLLAQYAKEDAETCFKLYHLFNEKLTGPVRDWFFNVEMPLLEILTKSELKGVKVDKKWLSDLKIKLKQKHKEYDQRLRFLSDKPDLNFNSSKQLQELLFNAFQLRPFKKTKTGYSTNAKTLKKLAEYHAFPKALLEYREMEKLLNTYVEPTLERLDGNNRIHGNYNQALTKTRRLSSDSPNLQNIPSRTKMGQEFKKSFIPEKGHYYLIADYSQVELRILAHFSNDPLLVDAFLNNGDIHEITADKLKIDRRFAKVINFSIIYGTTEYGLSDNLNCSLADAKNFIEKFFTTYKGVKKYIDDIQYEAKRTNGWLKSLAGLPLYVGDVHTNDKWEYQSIKNNCVNYRIQGSSQDIIKKAEVNIYKKYQEVAVLRVHDELVYERNTLKQADPKPIIYEMENAWKLRVPIKVEYKIAKRWEK